MNYKVRMSQQEQEKRIEDTLGVLLHKFIKLNVIDRTPGTSTLEMEASDNSVNATGFVHGGVIYSTLDVAGYMALLPLMEDNQNAVTHDIYVNILRPCPSGSSVIFKGSIVKAGKSLAFCESAAYCNDELIATARLTKSIIPFNREEMEQRKSLKK